MKVSHYIFTILLILLTVFGIVISLDRILNDSPVYLEGYGVPTNDVSVTTSVTNKLGSLPGEDTPLTPWHRRYVPGDVVDLSLDVDKDYDQRIVGINYYEKSYAELCGAVKKWHIPLPQKLTVRV